MVLKPDLKNWMVEAYKKGELADIPKDKLELLKALHGEQKKPVVKKIEQAKED